MYVVSGTEIGLFVVDGTNKVESDDSSTFREFMPSQFTFSKR